MKTLRAIVGAVLSAVALAGHAQPHAWRGQGGPPARAWGAGPRYAPQGGGYGRAYPPPYPARGYGPYPPARYAPGPGYGLVPYGPPPGGGRQSGVWRQQEEFLRQGVRQGQLAPLGSVIQNLRRVTPGRQLDSDLEYMGARPVYRVRWMTTNGRRMDYFVDATTGAILSGH